MADRRGLCDWSRRSRLGRRRAGCVVLLSGPPRPGGSVLPDACPAALESAAPPPLAFTIEHPAYRPTAGGTAVACLVAARLVRRFIAARPVAQRSQQQNCCCVTTRRRNLWFFRCLRRRCCALTARTLCLGMLGFGGIIQTPPGLAPRRLPTADLPPAFGILAVTLVGTPRLVLSVTAFAQAEPQPRSSRPGRVAALWITMRVAHGSVLSQGTARGERTIVLRGRVSKPASSQSRASLCCRQ
jgi:hypothetical protein